LGLTTEKKLLATKCKTAIAAKRHYIVCTERWVSLKKEKEKRKK